MNLENLTKRELIHQCQYLEIKGYSNKKKDELIEMILTKKQLIIRLKELNIKGYTNKKNDEIIVMIKETEQILKYEEEQQLKRKKFLDEYNDSLPQHKFFNEEFQQEMSVAIGGIHDSEYEEYVFANIDLRGRIKKIIEKELKVYNIVCLKCNLTLEPHTKEQHLDRNHEIHRCDTHHKMIKKFEICDCCVKGWNRANKFGLCSCICSKCKNLLRDCKYTCTDKIY